MPRLPSWWQAMQPPLLVRWSHSACVLIFGEMPFPSGPVPGNSFASGTCIIENQ